MRVLALAMLFLCCSETASAAFFGLFGDSARNVQAVDGRVSIDVSALAEGEAAHYRYREGKVSVRFFLVRDVRGTVRAALDACEVCWREDKGYKLVKNDGAMLCVNCGRRFPLDRIGAIRGGCNPHPVAFELEEGKVLIPATELMDGAGYFPGNGK